MDKSIYNKLGPSGKQPNYLTEMVEPIIEFESYYKNFKVNRIDIKSSRNFYYSIDDKKLDDSQNMITDTFISVQKVMKNDVHYTLPIATFIPISN